MQPGDVVVGGVVGQVVESNDPRVAKDDIVEGMLGWQEYAVAPAKSLRKLDPGAAPITTALYVLGVAGIDGVFRVAGHLPAAAGRDGGGFRRGRRGRDRLSGRSQRSSGAVR